MGNLLPKQSIPAEINSAKLNAVDLAFSDAEAQTAAFLVIYDGQIVAERYALGVDRDTLLDGASMGKSLLAALVGILVKDRQLGLYDPAPVPEWQRPGDLRSTIRIADLLRMSGGLHFTAPRDPDFSRDPTSYRWQMCGWFREEMACAYSVVVEVLCVHDDCPTFTRSDLRYLWLILTMEITVEILFCGSALTGGGGLKPGTLRARGD